MGSVRFDGEDDELQPSTSDGRKSMSSVKVLRECGAVNYGAVPRKLRSAIKKRARESIILPLPISRKKHRNSKNGVKKSRLIMKQGHVTKDEEEVAETLNALASMFSHKAKPTIVEATNSVTVAQDSLILNVQEEPRKMNTRVALHSTTNHSMDKVENVQSLDDVKQPELEFCKQSAIPSVSGVQSYLSLSPRPKISGPDMMECCENMIVWDQVSPSEIQPIIGKSFTADKVQYPQLVVEPNKPWKRCAGHVCIARLIKDLQTSDTSKGLMLRPTQLTTSGDIEQQLHTSIDKQKRRLNCVLSFNGFTHSASEKDLADVSFINLKNLRQNQQQYSKTSLVCSSLKQFLQGSAANEGINRSGYGLEALEHFQVQNLSAMGSPLPQNSYSSMFSGPTSPEAAPQVRLPPYYTLHSQQHKWTSEIPARLAMELPGWENQARDSDSLLNYSRALFPHFHSALGFKYQHFSPHPSMPCVDSSLALPRHHHHQLNAVVEKWRHIVFR